MLLLADDQRAHADTIHDHISALRSLSRHDVQLFNPRGIDHSRFLDLDRFDVVVVHYSILAADDAYLSPAFREQIAAFPGLKAQFTQDEYRSVDRATATTRAMGIDVLFTLVPEDQVAAVYADRLPGVAIVQTMAGYVPDELVGRRAPPPDSRPIDVGYRARPIPFWLGRLGQEKIQIGERFLEAAPRLGIRADIAWSEESRLYGVRWHRFLASCRATLGVESGSSIVDHDGSIERSVTRYLHQHPAASFDEVHTAVLAPYEGNAVINVVSPRVFEAASFHSALVLYPGAYSSVVEPWTHYIPLEKDFSNLAEVADAIRDTKLVHELTARAYRDLVASGRYSFRRLAAEFDAVISERATPRSHGRQRQRSIGLRVEETVAGRGFALSYGYVAAREIVHRTQELRLVLRAPLARRLLSRRALRNTALWNDVVRLALLDAAQHERLSHLGEPFRVAARLDHARRLLLRSETRGDDGVGTVTESELAELLERGVLTEIVWSHVRDGGVVWIPFGPKKLAFEVGRRGSYGIHSFEALVALGRRRPREVARALAGALDLPPS